MVRELVIIAISAFVLAGCSGSQLSQVPKSPDSSSTSAARKDKAQQQAEKLRQLLTEVQIRYFKDRLDAPIFLNYSKDREQKEYIFVKPNFYVQAITNPDDKVLAFSITTRSKDFSPTFDGVTNKITLGKTTLKELHTVGMPIEACYGFLGNTTPSFYMEKYYYPAGDYRMYLYGLNDAGYWNWHETDIAAFTEGELIARDVFQGSGRESTIPVDQYVCDTIPDKFRAQMPVNTRMVLSSKVNVEDLKFHFGVSRQQVRFIKNVIKNEE